MPFSVLNYAALATAVYEDPTDAPILSPVITGHWKKAVEDFYPDTLPVRIEDDLKSLEAANSANRLLLSKVTKEISLDTGLKAVVYLNENEKKSVLAIRGTATGDLFKKLDIGTCISDLEYVFNNRSAMLDQLIAFFDKLKKNPIIKQYPLAAITGHSLGGMMAKMLAPHANLPTVAFNSPGIKEYLLKSKPNYPINVSAPVVTYSAQGDPIGNFRHDCDVGKYIFLPIGPKIPEDQDRLKSLTFIEMSFKDLFFYHKMIDLFNYFLAHPV